VPPPSAGADVGPVVEVPAGEDAADEVELLAGEEAADEVFEAPEFELDELEPHPAIASAAIAAVSRAHSRWTPRLLETCCGPCEFRLNIVLRIGSAIRGFIPDGQETTD
jgi:hypothetical protein